MSIIDTSGRPFYIPDSENGRVVNITWTDDDEFKTFGKYKWKNGETKTVGDQEWWDIRRDANDFSIFVIHKKF